MATAKDIINYAASQVGITEKPNNNVIYNTEYYGHEVSGSEYSWCCVFIWSVFSHVNASELFYDGKKTALCQTLADWFRQKGCWHTTSPQPGDIIFFKFGTNSRYTDHVGIVTHINKDGSIETIEGNTSTSNQNNGGMVMRRTRRKNIVGYGRPKYSEQKPQAKPYLYKGIDVSAAQTNMDYNKLKQTGVEFGIIKIIRKDLSPDKMFEKHYAGFTSAGISVFGVYNYSYATTVEKARSDAEVVIKTLAGRKLLVCMDVEDNVQKNLGHNLIEIINAYQETIEAAGLPFILYTGMAFYNQYIKPFEHDLKCKDIWMARYYKGDTIMPFHEDPEQAKKPASNLVGWQYTSKGSVSGYNGDLDFDIIYRDIKAPSTTPKKIIVKVKTNGSKLNIRKYPTNGPIIGKYPNGTIIDILDVDYVKGWYKVNEGYISNEYVKSAVTGVITANKLNIRNSDSTKGQIVGTYKKSEEIEILKQSTTGWYLTPKGWISNNYVKLL